MPQDLLDKKPEVLLSFAMTLAVPLFFWPQLPEWFTLPKTILALAAALLLLLTVLWSAAQKEKITLPLSPLFLPLAVFAAANVASFITSDSRFGSALPLLTILVFGVLAFAVAVAVKNNEETEGAIFWGLATAGVIVTLAALLSITPVEILNRVPSLGAARNFSFLGSFPHQALFLLVVGALVLARFRANLDKKYLLLLAVLAIGLLGSAYQIYQLKPVFLSLDASWRVGLASWGDTVKSVLLGVGPGNFGQAYTLHKPMFMNATPQWGVRFGSSGSYFFEVMATLGLLGTLAFLFLVYRFFTMGGRLTLPLALLLLASLAIPLDTVSLWLIFVLLGVMAGKAEKVKEISLPASREAQEVREEPETEEKKDEEEQPLGRFFGRFKPQRILSNLTAEGEGGVTVSAVNPKIIAAATLAILAALPAGYVLGRTALADSYAYEAGAAANKNQGTEAYNLLVKAINTYPEAPGYHIALSQLELLFAQNLSQGQDLTDADKQTLLQLVQDAINQSRAAASLSPQSAFAWENMGNVYTAVIGAADGAQNWALQSYQQAVNLDPLNPRLRIALGGLFLRFGNYQNAADVLKLAVASKNDLPNARYNLAQAYKGMEQWSMAFNELAVTRALVCETSSDPGLKDFTGPESADCQAVTKELNEVKEKLPKTEAQTGEGATPATPSSLTKPSEAQSVELPQSEGEKPRIASESGQLKVEPPKEATPSSSPEGPLKVR